MAVDLRTAVDSPQFGITAPASCPDASSCGCGDSCSGGCNGCSCSDSCGDGGKDNCSCQDDCSDCNCCDPWDSGQDSCSCGGGCNDCGCGCSGGGQPPLIGVPQ